MVFNDQPMTRTFRTNAQRGGIAGGRGGCQSAFHRRESRVPHAVDPSFLHTPISLLRYGQQLMDTDPKYMKTCELCRPGSDHQLPGCVCVGHVTKYQQKIHSNRERLEDLDSNLPSDWVV